ncbi:uncharacterized protein LOC106660926 [Cimex lectularius]|uniref:Ig-like domain-containing protein n=1 Tax=Cimex lectularius TaxID=79782 RepID=A0A8I6TCL9_CIMLE|nr:uncharacterized protein LOC106660926 [Cimex lectularius]
MTVTLLVTIVTLLTGALGLKNVSLVILPQAVERGLEATLLCQYDLEGEPLYAVKWYRGVREFYRYSPNDNPPSKIFPYDGINVDVSMSNASQVVLSKVGFNLSGNLSCEVTTDSPFFKTAMVSNELMVIELPKRPPSILTEKERYDVGDMMRGNCTSSPSKPPAILNVYINNIAVSQTTTRYYNSGNGLQYSVLNLQVRIEPAHMGTNGQLNIRCTALVATQYSKAADLVLGPRTSEPVPERVTSPSESTRMLPCQLILMVLTPFLLR